MTPLKSIRKYCVKQCMVGQPKEVKLCPTENCLLFDLRFGHNSKHISVLRHIRARCLDCSAYCPKEVKNCEHNDCPLYQYRFAHNPKLKGKRGRGNARALLEYQQRKNQIHSEEKIIAWITNGFMSENWNWIERYREASVKWKIRLWFKKYYYGS